MGCSELAIERGVFILLGGSLILFDFEASSKANSVLNRGLKLFENKCLSLNRWDPQVGCFRNRFQAKEVWVSIRSSIALVEHGVFPVVRRQVQWFCGSG